MIGETLGGKYKIGRLLGEGGMGAVYEGRHIGTGRRVAIKVVTGDIAKSPKLVQRFEVEAKAAGTIESEHVVTVLDVGHDARGVPFMVMEYLAGEDLDSLIARTGPLGPEAAVKIAMQVCFALAQAHKLGIIHRDIKPGNIFLCARDGGRVTVKLVDFGVAKLTDEAGPGGRAKLTRTGAIIGSPLYMSPEQARMQSSKLDVRTDLWSLGIVLYEMLAGRTPLHDIEAIGELILAICSQPPPPLRSFAPWVNPKLAEAVERALVIDLNKRYASALEMAETLRMFSPGGSPELTASMLVAADRNEAAAPAAGDLTVTTAKEGRTPRPERTAEPAQAPAPAVTPAPAPAPRVEQTPEGAAAPAPRPAAEVAPAPHVYAKTAASEPLFVPPAGADAARIAPPLQRTRDAPGRSIAPFVIIALVLAAGAAGGAVAMGWIGGGAAVTAEVDPSRPPASLAALPSPAAPSSGAPAGSLADPLAPLLGAWKSDSGRLYDAVAAGGGLELRLRDASQLAGQGYRNGEARFVLSAIPNETSTFNVEDRVRPLPPENTSYDEARARATCLVTWTEISGKSLRASLSGDKLTLDLVVFKANRSDFVLEGARVVRCSGLTRAKVTETKSVLTKEKDTSR